MHVKTSSSVLIQKPLSSSPTQTISSHRPYTNRSTFSIRTPARSCFDRRLRTLLVALMTSPIAQLMLSDCLLLLASILIISKSHSIGLRMFPDLMTSLISLFALHTTLSAYMRFIVPYQLLNCVSQATLSHILAWLECYLPLYCVRMQIRFW